MKKGIRTIVYDEILKLEAYYFEGVVQSFPNHFHEYYVIGLIEEGERRLSCNSKEYVVSKGDILIFNPNDNHACLSNDQDDFNYRAINISKEIMLSLINDITNKNELFVFSKNVIINDEISYYLKSLHEMIMNKTKDFIKEEYLLLMMSLLFKKYGQPFDYSIPEYRKEIEKACQFIQTHYFKQIHLKEICQYCGISQSTLLRAFTKEKKMTPYRYLETIRINESKKLLEQGVSPIETAIQAGFSDQSHFTHYFNRFIGITPGTYYSIFSKQKGNDK